MLDCKSIIVPRLPPGCNPIGPSPNCRVDSSSVLTINLAFIIAPSLTSPSPSPPSSSPPTHPRLGWERISQTGEGLKRKPREFGDPPAAFRLIVGHCHWLTNTKRAVAEVEGHDEKL
ncbi:hypothetical protein M406DRAFT_102054 [Cryphonectria parasitica EP155]|uniref:Uncharacterized protein n=1 Tax=Cryphonectria parasitica (strain ATCC 38755 / EP155) TaxID=660469 RepID=A0A9P4Y6L0_CRYP1|nr:uncharacterized protein M406DRAFT_102054 [Cryphonectria parasitica EP155]KAF3767656.1 hypothetical protein M406DRAFT_102054 [Cryphonectria parasitica EP155]